MSDPRDKIAKDFLEVARELREAAKHAEVVAKHFAEKEIPRGCAHAGAVQGHIAAADELIKAFVLEHRKHAKPE